jgi:DNA mismatch repair protein MutS
MRVDRTTLRDLAVLDPGEEGTSLLALLDRTRTRLGSASLRSRMKGLPPRGEVRATQDAIRFLASRVPDVQRTLETLDPDAVEAYLSLKWQALTKRSRIGRLAERVSLQLRYHDAVRQLSSGVGKLHVLLEGLPRIADEMNQGPAYVKQCGRRLAALCEEGTIREVRIQSGRRSLSGILEADRLARGPARDFIRDAISIIADLDGLCALAATTIQEGWCFPEFDDAGITSFTGLRHALLPTGVPNDVAMDRQTRVLALTGPNMAGKSTLLKATGIAVYLAHLGCGVPASHARMSVFDALLASLYVRDSLSSGESFYLSEVRRIRDLMSILESTPRVFALLDEPFKGTNVHDASEATALLVDGLCAQSASAVIMSTHLASVVQSRMNDESLTTQYLAAVEGDSGLAFDYRLRPGVSEQRLGMVLLEREGVAHALEAAIQRRTARVAAT